jgi:DNA (cytosine-5)-methyltransferase 1
MKEYKILELFAGAGGLALGLEKAGLYAKYLVEIDKNASSTLKNNRKNWNVLNQDIKHFVENIFDYDLSGIDIVSGGFPCQPFSYAGKKLGIEDSRGTLFYDFVTVVMKIKPKVILAENVKGLLNHDVGKTWNVIRSSFEECGYKIFYKVLNSWNYGVAQKRERLILIGVRNDIKEEYIFPVPLEYKPVLKDVLIDVPKSEGYKYPKYKEEVFDLVPQGGCHRNLPEEIAKEYMGASYYLGGGKTGIARRISWNEPCLTLTTSPMQKQTDRCHPEESRPFTVREYARIQSFPDDWIFQGSVSSQYKQIGNAVPVNMAYHLGKSIKEFLDKIDFEN